MKTTDEILMRGKSKILKNKSTIFDIFVLVELRPVHLRRIPRNLTVNDLIGGDSHVKNCSDST